jgi:hypothetical protein
VRRKNPIPWSGDGVVRGRRQADRDETVAMVATAQDRCHGDARPTGRSPRRQAVFMTGRFYCRGPATGTADQVVPSQ